MLKVLIRSGKHHYTRRLRRGSSRFLGAARKVENLSDHTEQTPLEKPDLGRSYGNFLDNLDNGNKSPILKKLTRAQSDTWQSMEIGFK